MFFPAFKVVDAPFHVEFCAPSIAKHRVPFHIKMNVTSKLNSLERLNLIVEFRDHMYAIIGSTNTTIEVCFVYFLVFYPLMIDFLSLVT